MSVIISKATLTNMPTDFWQLNRGMFGKYDGVDLGYSLDYHAMYERHMNVKICVDFLARNLAHLGIHIYQRDEKNNRERVRDHHAAKLLKRPLPAKNKSSQYRLLEAVFSDMLISGNGYILKLRDTEQRMIGLLRVPYMNVAVKGVLAPSSYNIAFADGVKAYKPEDIIHVRTYSTGNNTKGISPLEGLREVLAEEFKNVKYSSKFWDNAARISGVIERPMQAPDWSDTARNRFRQEFKSMYSGEVNSGETAVLEEGMTFKPISFSPRDSMYIDSRKLTREECARAFHIPPPMVGILDRATFNNISEQHKSLYRDVLGPLCANIEDDLDTQYLSEFEDLDGAYTEFNIEEKLQGDFEQQANSLRQATGVPWMTPNEGRARMNLPRIEDPEADKLVTPLNMMALSNLENPNDGKKEIIPTEYESKSKDKGEVVLPDFPDLEEEYLKKWQVLLTKTFTRQRDSILPKAKAVGTFDQLHLLFDKQRWVKEMTEDFVLLSKETANAFGHAWAKQIGEEYDEEKLSEWLETNGRIAAEYLNESLFEDLQVAMASEAPIEAMKKVFELALAVTVARFAQSRMTALENKVEVDIIVESPFFNTKIWQVRSTNPRHTHAAMHGVEVGKKDYFPNGLFRPGDYKGSAEETVNCRCKLAYRKVAKP